MTQLSRETLEKLWNDGEFALSRGGLIGNPARILLLAPAWQNPVPEIIARLERVYGLREELAFASAVRPLQMLEYDGRPALALEDPGGELLAQLVGQRWELSQFLRTAIGIAVALDQLHSRGLIHRDLNPANILVDLSTGQAWLTGTRFAAGPSGVAANIPPEEVTRTLAFVAPEQTGRMNRSVDARSDLYSFGVVLYQMLTGQLPFMASDPIEWIHSHIARQPPSPSERLPDIPETVSAIVLKLLSKTPEERYQSATTLAADLRSCQTGWNTYGRIEPFPLGRQDVADRLLIPEKLYGRDQECQELNNAFHRVVVSGKSELVLVSGHSGIGKSSIVNQLRNRLVTQGAFFASGKCEQYKREIPYSTLAQALQTLIHQILGRNDEEVNHWREVLRQELGPNGRVIVNFLPELELIIGNQPPVPDLPPQEAQNRFQMAFRRFVGAFTRPQHPLTLFLDDLQWLDTATLELLEPLMVDPDTGSLLLVGAYRDNEVGPSHPLLQSVDILRASGAVVNEIVLAPLGAEDLSELLVDALGCDPVSAWPIAELVHEKTGGNPLFVIQFLTSLAEERLLQFETTRSVWSWDLPRIRAKNYTDNLGDFMAAKLERLSYRTQELLSQLACLGGQVEFATLGLLRGETEETIHAVLWEAVNAGLIIRLETTYRFLHDRVQEAAYGLIAENERAAVHLQIGRTLVSRMTAEETRENVFEIVNQFNRASALIDSSEERARVAELNLIAGNRAKASTAYASALTFFIAGRALLPEASWEQGYQLIFALELQRAECEFLTSRFAAAEQQLTNLSGHAAGIVDRAAVARLLAEVYASVDQNERAVEAGLGYLRGMGIEWPMHPSDDEVRQEYNRIWRKLGSRSIEALVDLPAMSDPTCRATLDVLTAIEEPAYFTDQNLRCLIVARMVNLSLEHGNGDGSCVAYVQLGWFVGPRFGDYQAAFRFGQLGLELVEKHRLERFRARVSQCFGYFINPWARHLRSSIELLRRSFLTAQEAGDVKYAVYACDRLVTVLLAVGEPLENVQLQAETTIEFARKAKFEYIVDIITGQLRFIRTLRGLTPSFSSFNDLEFDEERFEKQMETNPHSVFATCWYWIRKLRARFYAGDYTSALAAAAKAGQLLLPGIQHFEAAEYLFYDALAHAAAFDTATEEERVRYRETVVACRHQIALLAANCPANFESCAALISAEIARIEDRELDAERLYEEAVRSARAHGFVQNEAVAHEMSARFYSRRGLETIARACVQNAWYSYVHWGALGKAKQLEIDYPHFFKLFRSPAEGTLGSPLENIDVQALAKASQAVSSELDLSKLIETLLIITLKNAGAERGAIVLLRGDEPHIEAEAITEADTVTVTFRQTLLRPAELPDSLLRYVMRTQESIILDDALVPNQFSADRYLRDKRVRSVLCLPLVKQGRVKGALYLENSLASHVFTPERVSVLTMLVSQASISLDHARLVAELTQENEDRKKAEAALRQREASLREVQTELAHVSRVTTMGELAASIAHEVNQPLAGIVTNGNASLHWLAAEPPNLAEACDAVRRIIRDARRAGDVIGRIRALSKKAHPTKEPLDINQAIEEVIVLTRSESRSKQVTLRSELAAHLPPVMGDRVQLQQVVVNLILNGIEAMSSVHDRTRELVVKTELSDRGQILVSVKDSGTGFDLTDSDRIFEAFYTTKPDGLGMGLSISRSIVESHGGRLWALRNDGPGMTFQFSL